MVVGYHLLPPQLFSRLSPRVSFLINPADHLFLPFPSLPAHAIFFARSTVSRSSSGGPAGGGSSEAMGDGDGDDDSNEDEDQDAFSDDSAAYMEDMMMLRAEADDRNGDSGAPASSGGGAGEGTAAGGAGAGGKRGGLASSGGSVSGAMSMEEEEEDEEEFSEPGEEAFVDDETTLLEVRTYCTHTRMKRVTRGFPPPSTDGDRDRSMDPIRAVVFFFFYPGREAQICGVVVFSGVLFHCISAGRLFVWFMRS